MQQRWTLRARHTLVGALRAGAVCDETCFDTDLDMVRDQLRRFTAQQITPHAHQWHLADALIPDTRIAQLAQLGVFGLCIPATEA